MKSKSFNRYIGLLILILNFLPLHSEEEIDIWSKNQQDQIESTEQNTSLKPSINKKIFNNSENNKVEIENEILENNEDEKIYGIYDPAKNDYDLNMWSQTNDEDVRLSIKRINKIKLSKTAEKIFEYTFFSFAYPPKEMTDKEEELFKKLQALRK